MQISIIIPTLNEARGIAGTLAPLQRLRAAGHEIVLVDGASTDRTRSIARPLVDRVIESSPGRAVQMNAGAGAASGDVLWFLHADTLACEQCQDALLDIAESRGHSRYWGRFDVQLDGSGPFYRVIGYMMNLRSRVTSVATGDQGIFISSSLYQQAGGYAALPLMEDIEYSKRLRRFCTPLTLAPRLLSSSRRWQQAGVIRTVLLMWWLRLGYVCGVCPQRLAKWYG